MTSDTSHTRVILYCKFMDRAGQQLDAAFNEYTAARDIYYATGRKADRDAYHAANKKLAEATKTYTQAIREYTDAVTALQKSSR